MVVPASYVYLLRDGSAGTEVLLGLRDNTGYRDGFWAAGAAGHVEKGETVAEAAAREALEEIGVTGLDLVPWCAMQRTAPVGRGAAEAIDERVDYFFTARSWRCQPRIMEPEKCAGLGWFPLDALPDPVVPHEAQVLASLLAGSTPPVVTFGF